MAYKKQKFINNSTVLTAEMLDHIEDGIATNDHNIDKLTTAVNNMSGNTAPQGATARIGYVTLYADKWVGESSPYSQIVEVEGVTENSQVDLTPNVDQLAIFYGKDLAFVTENYGGTVTVYAIGQKPENTYTIQATITEVSV